MIYYTQYYINLFDKLNIKPLRDLNLETELDKHLIDLLLNSDTVLHDIGRKGILTIKELGEQNFIMSRGNAWRLHLENNRDSIEHFKLLLRATFYGAASVSSLCSRGLFIYSDRNCTTMADAGSVEIDMKSAFIKPEEFATHMAKLTQYHVRVSDLKYFPVFHPDEVSEGETAMLRTKAFEMFQLNEGRYSQKIKSNIEKSPPINSQRHLILLGWMAAKGFNKGDRIKGFDRMTVWFELAKFFPYEYDLSLKPGTVEKFFKKCKQEGICRFSD
jgi:hypothetical protein